MSEQPKIVQVVMHEPMREALGVWLHQRGFELHKQPWEDDGEDLETWFVFPGEQLMREAKRREAQMDQEDPSGE